MSAHWKVWPDAASTAEACAKHLLSVLETALAGDSEATIAFSGGSTPKLMFDAMVRQGFDWSSVQVFFVDERMVPPNHPDSNYGMAEKHLIGPARIPHRNVHRMHGELPPEQSAWHYRNELRQVFHLEEGQLPHFDAIHLGMGADAHTASLFPGEPLIEDRDQTVGSMYVEKLTAWRVSLLPGVLLSARHIGVLVAGDDKAEALHRVLHGQYDPMQFPSQIIAHNVRSASWFLDKAAARLLDTGA